MQDVSWKFIKNAWVPVVTICEQKLYNPTKLPSVSGLSITLSGVNATIDWVASDLYWTEIEYQTDDGDWVSLALLPPGESEV